MPFPEAVAVPWWRSPRLLAALLIAATVLAYLPALHADFVWDDDDYVTQNPLLREPGGFWRIWFEPSALPQYYPLVHSTFWLEYRLWGMSAAGYHAVNVVLHALNALLVWRVLLRLRVPGPLFAAALFALHPVHVESVAWVTERKNVLSGLCYLLSLRAWLRWTADDAPTAAGKRAPIAAFCWFLAALLAKTVTCSLPAVFLVIAWWQKGRLPRREVLASLPFFALGLVLAVVTAVVERNHVRAEGVEFAFTVADRLLIAGRAPWFYLGTLVWPVDLSFNYVRWRLDTASVAQWAFPVATVALLASLFALRGRLGRGPLAAALFFGGSLVPALGFVNVFPMRYSLVADHFQYLASLGPLALFAAAAASLRDRATAVFQRVGGAAALVALSTLGALVFAQARAYHDLETLWTDTLRKNPDSWLALTNLAGLQLQRGEHAAAIAALERATTIYEAGETRMALGNARLAAGDARAARREHERAVALMPHRNDAKAWLGQTLLVLGEPARALVVLQEALSIREDYDRARAFTGAALHALGRHAEALPHLRRALELNGFAVDALRTMATVQLALGDADQALACATNVLYFDPEGPDSRRTAIAVLPVVLARLSPEQAGAIASELRTKLPVIAQLTEPLLAALAGTPAVAAAVRRELAPR